MSGTRIFVGREETFTERLKGADYGGMERRIDLKIMMMKKKTTDRTKVRKTIRMGILFLGF